MSYTEAWSIEGTPDLPVFRREDSLGGERTESLEGVTLYTTTSADPAGNWFKGSFERDGSRKGSFRMLRAGTGQGAHDQEDPVGAPERRLHRRR